MKHRTHRTQFLKAGSESLIDILSNTVGSLALLCIMATLDAGNLKWHLFISKEQSVATTPVVFVVENGYIKPFSLNQLVKTLERLPPGSHRLPATRELAFDVNIEKKPNGEAALHFERSSQFTGDRVDTLLAKKGQIAAKIQELDAKKYHLFIHLAPDSFDLYLTLRSYCQTYGINLGWTPLIDPLNFSYGSHHGKGEPPIESIVNKS